MEQVERIEIARAEGKIAYVLERIASIERQGHATLDSSPDRYERGVAMGEVLFAEEICGPLMGVASILSWLREKEVTEHDER